MNMTAQGERHRRSTLVKPKLRVTGRANTSSSIVEFAKKQTLPTVSVLATKGQHDGFLAKESGEVVLIGYFDPDDKASHTTLYAAAERLHEDIPIGVTSDRSAAAAAGVSFPAVVMHKPNDEGRVTYAGAPDDVEAIKTFAKTTYSPLIGELGQETWKTYLSGAGGPMAFIFARTDAERKALADELRPLAKRFRGSLTFATADVPDFSGFAGHLHLENHAEKDFPALAVYDGASKGKFPFPAQGDADALRISRVGPFVEDFLGGRLAPAVLSEPLPPTAPQGGGEGSSPVTKVVANSFGSVVLDDSRDVLIYYHRDDCPYCQALNPVYESIAAAYGSLDKVVVAKMDIMRNDVPEDIPYIPYVKLYKAGDKAHSLLYQGPRTFQEIVKFVKENGSHGNDPAHEQVGLDNSAGGGGGAQKPMAEVEPLQGVTPVKHIHDEL